MTDELYNYDGNMLEVTFKRDEDFLIIAETLRRIGVYSKKDNTLWQSCHILHKANRYYIVHFKEMFVLDGVCNVVPEVDIIRRNTVAYLLKRWGMVDFDETMYTIGDTRSLCVKKHADVRDLAISLKSKYTIGK